MLPTFEYLDAGPTPVACYEQNADLSDVISEHAPTPFVVKGYAAHWPATSDWSFEYFRDTCGERKIWAWKYGARQPVMLKEHAVTYERMSVRSLLDRVEERSADESADEYYSGDQRIEQLPEVCGDIVVPEYIVGDLKRLSGFVGTSLFLGADTYASMHYHHELHTFVVCVSGTKTFLLAPPSQSQNVYMLQNSNMCAVDFLHPDLSRFPRLRQLDATICELAAGDLLFIPPFWLHSVWSSGQSAIVNFLWRSRDWLGCENRSMLIRSITNRLTN